MFWCTSELTSHVSIGRSDLFNRMYICIGYLEANSARKETEPDSVWNDSDVNVKLDRIFITDFCRIRVLLFWGSVYSTGYTVTGVWCYCIRQWVIFVSAFAFSIRTLCEPKMKDNTTLRVCKQQSVRIIVKSYLV